MRSLRPCSDSSATPSFPSQPEGKFGELLRGSQAPRRAVCGTRELGREGEPRLAAGALQRHGDPRAAWEVPLHLVLYIYLGSFLAPLPVQSQLCKKTLLYRISQAWPQYLLCTAVTSWSHTPNLPARALTKQLFWKLCNSQCVISISNFILQSHQATRCYPSTPIGKQIGRAHV